MLPEIISLKSTIASPNAFRLAAIPLTQLSPPRMLDMVSATFATAKADIIAAIFIHPCKAASSTCRIASRNGNNATPNNDKFIAISGSDGATNSANAQIAAPITTANAANIPTPAKAAGPPAPINDNITNAPDIANNTIDSAIAFCIDASILYAANKPSTIPISARTTPINIIVPTAPANLEAGVVFGMVANILNERVIASNITDNANTFDIPF